MDEPAHHQLWSQQGPHFIPHSTAKTNDKSIFLRKSGLGSISDVVIASVHSEKTLLKKVMMIKSNGLYLESGNTNKRMTIKECGSTHCWDGTPSSTHHTNF